MIEQILSGNDVPPFVLYLRPFAIEKATRKWKDGANRGTRLLLDEEPTNFDYFIQHELDQRGMLLVSIGLPTDKEGAGHVITADALWQEHFRQLAVRAKTIVTIPGMWPGIMNTSVGQG